MEISEKIYQNLIQRNKELEEENGRLKNSHNDFYSEILDTISEPISIVDKNYKYRYVNSSYAKYFNMSVKDIIGKCVSDFVDIENFKNEIKPHFDKCLKGENIEYENSVDFGNGKGERQLLMNYYPHYNQNNIIDGIISTAKDITELSTLKKDWKDTINSLDDILIIINNDFEIEDINKNGLNLLNKTKNEVIGRKCFKVIHNTDHPESYCPLCITKQTKKSHTTEHFEKIFDRWYSLKSSPVYNEKGEIIKYVDLMRDITELKTKEKELIKAKEKAEESDRLKSAFLQNISHEIRTPLNAISGFSRMLNKPNLSDDKRNSFVSIIQTSSNQLLSIVTDILTISSLETKQEKLNIEKVCINNIIIDLLSIFKQQTKNQNISIYAKQPLNDKQSEIYTDRTKITQILSNLISNAIKFTHEGFIEFGYSIKNNDLEFYVKDSGIGIKAELQEIIFERFRQADLSINKKYGGTGLGLAISKAFIDLLGGKIWVQSEIEKGSIFYFTIPYKPVNEIEKTKATNNLNNKPIILVAEDEEFNFLYIEELLIDFDYKLIHAKDGQETVEIFKTNSDISLILMDIKMPIMDGHTAEKIIKEQKFDIPIVAQSAYALEHERAKYEGIFDDYLTKPINEDDLIEKVTKYMNNK